MHSGTEGTFRCGRGSATPQGSHCHKGSFIGYSAACACFGGDISIVNSIIALPYMSERDLWSGVDLGVIRELAEKRRPSGIRYSTLYDTKRTGRHIVCLPVLLAAEASHLELLRWMRATKEYWLHAGTWGLLDVGPEPAIQHRTFRASQGPSLGFPHSSVHSSFGPSYASKASTSSAWSFLGFTPTSSERKTPQSTLLMWAAASLNPDLIHLLLEYDEVSGTLNHRDQFGKTALHYAASPFSNAVFKNVGKCVRQLVSSGADPSQVDSRTRTPLMLTVADDHATLNPRVSRNWGSDIHLRCVAALLDNNASVRDIGFFGYTVLMCAIEGGCPTDSIGLICERGATLNATDCAGRTALHVALQRNASEIVVSTLLRHGAKPNVMSSPGRAQLDTRFRGGTPLLDALENTAPDAAIRILLEYGANPDLRGHQGETPRMVALSCRRAHLLVTSTTRDQAPENNDAADNTTEMPSQSWLRRISTLPVPLFRRTTSKPT